LSLGAEEMGERLYSFFHLQFLYSSGPLSFCCFPRYCHISEMTRVTLTWHNSVGRTGQENSFGRWELRVPGSVDRDTRSHCGLSLWYLPGLLEPGPYLCLCTVTTRSPGLRSSLSPRLSFLFTFWFFFFPLQFWGWNSGPCPGCGQIHYWAIS
jgi:hypothetical protein